MKFKVKDNIIVTAGKHKGQKAQISKILPGKNQVIISGLNQYKKHLKPQQTGAAGKIITLDRPLPTANIALNCKKCHRPTKIGYLVDKNGQKQRICRQCKTPLISQKE